MYDGESEHEDAVKTGPERIVIMPGGRIRSYISAAEKGLSAEAGKENGIELVATGKAISKAVSVAELLKRIGCTRGFGGGGGNDEGEQEEEEAEADSGEEKSGKGGEDGVRKMVYQQTVVCSAKMIDSWEPMEEGLDAIETERSTPCLRIVLTCNPNQLDPHAPGFQKPLEGGALDPRDRELMTSTIAALDLDDSTATTTTTRTGPKSAVGADAKGAGGDSRQPARRKSRRRRGGGGGSGRSKGEIGDDGGGGDRRANVGVAAETGGQADGVGAEKKKKKNPAARRRKRKPRGSQSVPGDGAAAAVPASTMEEDS
eukprot:CAMPEP_0185852894 /NCGR_PEP_ID=MMETSP1354-20130828/16767_1 /TAXON_ID=708628 /ORGANISM="Erythrolobus madagascarensis, Strain CCMP3276" /LENGTH=314 /DNA_ID=CAMNT_0028554257 /DNA_START=30 /DNA_END=974 /DNA_ORIENTATION=+